MAKQPSKPTTTAERHVHPKPQDAAISHGFAPNVPMTEDEKRAAGVDASQGAGEHDPDPAVNRGTGGAVVDAYSGSTPVEHPNVGDQAASLVLGQAPVVPARPAPGAPGAGEQFDPNKPNAINQSPVVRGIDEETGERTEGPSFEDLAAEESGDGKPKGRRRP